MSASRIRLATRDQWQQIVDNCHWATFFHTPAWSEILVAAFPRWRSEARAIEYDGRSILFPYLSYPLFGTLRYTEGMVPGVYGGLVAADPLDEDALLHIWKALLPQTNFIVYGNPYMRQGLESAFLDSGIEVRKAFTLALSLDRDYETLFQKFRKSYRQNIRRPSVDGITIHVSTSPQDVEGYYWVYRNALKRWGKRASGFYPARLFQAMATHPQMGQTIKLWVAKVESEVIGGIWVFYHNQHAVYWHGATNTQYLPKYISHALVAAAIRNGCDGNMRWFDFNPSGGHPGVELFKRGFGAQELEFPIIRKMNSVGKSYRLFRHLKQRVFKKTPL